MDIQYSQQNDTYAQVKQILSNMPMIFAIIDKNGIFQLSEGQGLYSIGLKPGQVVGLSAVDVYADQPDVLKTIEMALQGQVVHEEVKVGDSYVESFITPNYDPSGNIVGCIAGAIDITDKKLAEIELAKERRISEAVMASVPGMLYMYNAEGKLVYWNDAHKTMTGYSDAELENMSLENWYRGDPDSLKAVTEGLGNMHITGFGEAEANLQTKFGTTLPMHFTACPLTMDGKTYFVGMGMDMSSRKKIEAQLIELNRTLEDKVATRTEDLLSLNYRLTDANKELAAMNEDIQAINAELEVSNKKLRDMQTYLVESEKMAALGGLVAGVAHEVNTPIGVSVTAASHLSDVAEELYASLEKKEPDNDLIKDLLQDVKKASNIIVRNLNHAGYLIQNFKQLSVDQSMEPQREFDLGQYLDEVLVSISPTYKKSNVTIKTHYSEKLIMNGWPGAFGQIITNLVMNSMQHAFLPGEAGRIDIELSSITDGFLMLFSDNGHGMSRDVLDRIFEPFFTTKRSSGGTGLGLSIVYTIVTQRFHGSIRCESEPEKGTRFIIELLQGGARS